MIEIIHTTQGSKHWLDYRRENGIGCSEIGAILGSDEYNDIFKVFSEKVGLNIDHQKVSESAFWGKQLESVIATAWMFYDNQFAENYVPNFVFRLNAYLQQVETAKARGEKLEMDKFIFRKCKKAKGLVRNSQFPWLLLSPDRIILPNQIKLTDGLVNDKFGYLEIKKISFWNAKQYINGIPPQYHSQMEGAMLVMDVSYSELAILGDTLRVIPYVWDQKHADMIVEKTHSFWYGNVLPAREVYSRIQSAEQAGEPTRVIEELWAEFQEFEPEPSNEEGYAEYLRKTRSVDIGNIMLGTDELLDAAEKYQAMNCAQKILTKAQLKYKNYILNLMTAQGVTEVQWKTGEWIRNKPDSNKSNPTFRISDKIYPYENQVAKQLVHLDFDKMFEEMLEEEQESV